jgi:hypothetical protein
MQLHVERGMILVAGREVKVARTQARWRSGTNRKNMGRRLFIMLFARFARANSARARPGIE